MPEPYYTDEQVTLFLGDCLEVTDWLDADVLVTDPPFGIGYESGAQRVVLPNSIIGDESTAARDRVLEMWSDRAALVFGTWRIQRPTGTRALLVWDTKGALGMGDTVDPLEAVAPGNLRARKRIPRTPRLRRHLLRPSAVDGGQWPRPPPREAGDVTGAAHRQVPSRHHR